MTHWPLEREVSLKLLQSHELSQCTDEETVAQRHEAPLAGKLLCLDQAQVSKSVSAQPRGLASTQPVALTVQGEGKRKNSPSSGPANFRAAPLHALLWKVSPLV